MAIIQIKRGTAAEWNAANPILALAELGLETDTNKMKAGDGVTAWSGLTYMTGDGGGGGAVESVNGRVGQVMLDKTDVGLGVVDNTSDLDKPISTATQTALDAKGTAADVTALDGRVTTNEANIATNTSDISALQTASGGNTGDITALDGRVTANEGNIATNTANIATNTGNIGAKISEVSEDTTPQLGGELDVQNFAITSGVDNIQVAKDVVPVQDGRLTWVLPHVSLRTSTLKTALPLLIRELTTRAFCPSEMVNLSSLTAHRK